MYCHNKCLTIRYIPLVDFSCQFKRLCQFYERWCPSQLLIYSAVESQKAVSAYFSRYCLFDSILKYVTETTYSAGHQTVMGMGPYLSGFV